MDHKLFFDHRERVTRTSSKTTSYKCNSKWQNQNFHLSEELYSFLAKLYATHNFFTSIHFRLMSHFYTPWKRQNTENNRKPLVSGGIEMEHWATIGSEKIFYFNKSRSCVFAPLSCSSMFLVIAVPKKLTKFSAKQRWQSPFPVKRRPYLLNE